MSDEPTIQRILKGYKDAGDAGSAARLLRHLSKRDRGTVRRYPNPSAKTPPPSGDWQLTRSHAAAAITTGVWNPSSLIGIHVIDAFTARPGESIEDRRKRAVEVFGACLDAAESLNDPVKLDFARTVDALTDAAVRILESGRFPTKAEVISLTGAKNKDKKDQEWTKLLAAAHLTSARSW